MNKLGRLIKNELLKKFKQTSTIVLSLIFIGFCLIIPILTRIDYSDDYSYSAIDNQIDNLEYEIEDLREMEESEINIGQLEVRLDVFKKAKEYGVSGYEDWRYSMLSQLEYMTAGMYEVELILEGKIDPENIEKSEEYYSKYGYSLLNASGLLGSEKPSDEQLNEMLDDFKSQIDEYWDVIETDDYTYYYKQQLEQIKLQKADYESQHANLNNMESLTDDQKREVFSLETQLEKINAIIELYNYSIDNSIEAKSWQDTTLNEILSNYSSIATTKLSIYDLENGFDAYNDYYSGYGYYEVELTDEDRIELAQEELEKFENENLVYWESLENDTPVIEIAGSTRAKSLSYLSMTMFAAIIALFIASNIVSGEFSRKTINMLVIRPVKRWKIITSKYITVLITAYAVYLVGLIVFVLANGISFGFSDFANPYIYALGGEAHSVNFFLYMLGQAMFCSVTIVFMVTIAFMMSTLAKNTALAGITSMGIFIGGGIAYSLILATVKNSIKVLKYTFLPYIDLSQFAGNASDYMGLNTQLMPSYGAWHLLALSAVMFVISLVVFNKRDIKL